MFTLLLITCLIASNGWAYYKYIVWKRDCLDARGAWETERSERREYQEKKEKLQSNNEFLKNLLNKLAIQPHFALMTNEQVNVICQTFAQLVGEHKKEWMN